VRVDSQIELEKNKLLTSTFSDQIYIKTKLLTAA